MSDATDVRIVPTADEHIAGFRSCVGIVARERRWLALLEAPPIAMSRAFVREVRDAGGVHLVALDRSGAVIGWCDIARDRRESFRHCGRLGMGLLPEWRERGIGRRLAETALADAAALGLERVELSVFASNVRALALYESLGFEREGVRRRGRKLDGAYEDDILMVRFLGAAK